MRRNEFEITSKNLQDKILNSCNHGVLALLGKEGFPYQVPLNYTVLEKKIYFHSALQGLKMELIETNNKAHFNIVDPLSLIPSYFTDKDKPCNATQFFLSLSVRGEVELITDLSAKQKVMMAMMKDLQPEGGHPVITEKQVKGMALMELKPKETTAKFKAGQNLSIEKFNGLVAALQERGTKLDQKTLFWMKELYPTN